MSEAESDGFIPFDTWNGKKSLYIMDEDGSNVELTNVDAAPEGALAYRPHAYERPSKERREKIRQRKKNDKQARRKNRRPKK